MSYEPREFLRHILAEAEYLSSLQPRLTRAALVREFRRILALED